MKTGSTRIAILRLLIFVILLLYSLLVFSQATTVLPARTLVQLSASDKREGVELKGTLMSDHTFDKIMIERTMDGLTFHTISHLPITDNTTLYPFSFIDELAGNGTNYYRVRLINSIHNLQEISSVLMIRRGEDEIEPLKLLNTMVQTGNPIVTLSTTVEDEASFEVREMTGLKVSEGKLKLNHGNTQFYLPGIAGRTGFFVIIVRTKKNATKQRIIIQ